MRFDEKIIFDYVKEGSKVLDLGCGKGTLIKALKKKNVKGVGIEIDKDLVEKAVTNHVSVVHQNLDDALKNYKDGSFDYVVMNETLQVVKNTLDVLENALRVGRTVVVGLPNFARWKIRLGLAFSGYLPKNPALPYEWHDTPNVRIVTVNDFRKTCRKRKIIIVDEFHYIKQKDRMVKVFPNFFATNSIFILKR